MSDFGFYSGEEFLAKEMKPRKFLVDRFLRENDSLFIVGKPKAGKSIFTFQLICALTSGEPFLGELDVPEPVRVAYIQLEGSLADSQDRMKRMMQCCAFNPANFCLKYSEPMALQRPGSIYPLITELVSFKPQIVILDPVYFALSGSSLTDDNAVVGFVGNLRILQESLNCAVILLHHTRKDSMDAQGKVIITGDQASFGSVFFLAWATHIAMLQFDKASGVRSIHVATQRSGDIIPEFHMNLHQPDPLFFEMISENHEEVKMDRYSIILQFLQSSQISHSANDIINKTNISKRTFYLNIKRLLTAKKVVKELKDGFVKFRAVR